MLSKISPLKIRKAFMSVDKWNPKLDIERLKVLRDKHTELPYKGAYLNNKEKGTYHCANCDQVLYSSEAKFDSGCGWPSFYKEINDKAVKYYKDESHGMVRVEICCNNCDGHLGHYFENEGWDKRLGVPNDARHCVNSCSLNFKNAENNRNNQHVNSITNRQI